MPLMIFRFVNNAGIAGDQHAAISDQRAVRQCHGRTRGGTCVLTQLVAPCLIKTKGCVVNISSCSTSTIIPGFGVCVMSKAALDTYTRYLAHEMVSHGVRVNAVKLHTHSIIVSPVLERRFGQDGECRD
ncbi:L-xylulose reductase-like [Haliotis rubra]|uniref:L-xylulose reductase-like n=1 Tax=Haliotis rubra TaxID=36100 RepID=UPI001EE56B93|nr:L-xylulose reductase-like [Haliotis rubra]